MAEEAPIEKAKKIRRSPRGIVRWLVRFIGLSAAVIAGILLLVAVISSIAYFNRARILNQTLAVLVEPFRVSVGEINFHRLGEVRITDLRLTPKNAPAGSLLAIVPETIISYRLSDLRAQRKLHSVVMRGAEVVIDDILWAALAAPTPVTEPGAASGNDFTPGASAPDLEPGAVPAEKKSGAPFDLTRLAFFTDSFVIRESRLTLALEGLPRLEADWLFRTGGLAFDESGLSREAIDFRLTHLRLGEKGKNGEIARLSASARVRPDLSQIHLSSLEILRPQLRLTPDLLSSPASAQTPLPTEEGQRPDPTGSPAAFELLIDSLRVDRGEFEVADFDGADGGASFPDLSFETSFAFEDLSLKEGQWKSGGPLSLTLNHLGVGSGAAQLLSVWKVKLSLTELGAFVQGHEISSVDLEGLDLLVSDLTLARFRRGNEEEAKEKPEDQADAEPEAAVSDAGPDAVPWTLARLTLADGSLLVQHLSTGEKKAPYLESKIEATLEKLSFGRHGFQSEATQSLTLEQTKLRAPAAEAAAEPLLAIERAELSGRWSEFQKNQLIDRLVVKGPIVNFTDKTLGAWLTAAVGTDDDPVPLEQAVYKIARLDLTGGKLVADSSFAVGKVPKIYADFSLRSGHAPGEAPYSYHLRFDDFQVRNHSRLADAPGPPTPPSLFPASVLPLALNPLNEGDVISVKEIEVDFTADQVQRTRRIGKVKMSGAVLTVGEGLKSIAKGGETEEEKPASGTSVPKESAPELLPVLPAKVSPTPVPPPRLRPVLPGRVAPVLPSPSPEPSSAAPSSAAPSSTAPAPAPAPEPDSAAPNSTAPAPAPNSAAAPNSTAPAPAANSTAAGLPVPPAKSGRRPGWLIEEVEITRSQVQFEAIIPQVEGLRFAIETQLTDVPLSLDGLLAEKKLQKIELAGIEIKDPYNSFITVAFLPTIFVEFSLAGLARQEVEKIDLISPALHVGQGLFWWIDYQRNFREQNEGARVGIDDGAATGRKPDWVIKTINATAGKIVIAPTGIPIGIVPFPFNATTNMSGGTIELKLNIPDEDHVYQFPDYKVDLYGLTGDVEFNVPVQEVDNNLVQTFKLKSAVWKEHRAEDLYITVTFDADGVYGQFGGASYDGYAEGQFNFYLNDPGKWDAWIAGTQMDTGPLTKVLVPDSFLMEGRVSLKVIAEGRDKIVGETTGEFHTTTPGWFDVTKLEAILQKLPPEWNTLKRSLTELSINTLKRFDYDKGAGSLSFEGRAGDLNLRFAGDDGSRELNIHLHDQSKTNPKPIPRMVVTGAPDPLAPQGEAPLPAAPPKENQ